MRCKKALVIVLQFHSLLFPLSATADTKSAVEKLVDSGYYALDKRKFGAACEYFSSAVASAEMIDEPEARDRLLIAVLAGSIRAYDGGHDFRKADELQQRKLAIEEHFYGSNSPLFAIGVSSAANRFLDHGQFTEGEKLFRRVLIIRENLFQHRAELAWDLAGLAKCLQGQQKFSEAEDTFQRCLKLYFPDCEDLDQRLANLGNCYRAEGNKNDAKIFLSRAIEVRSEYRNLKEAERLALLANIRMESKEYVKAEHLYKNALHKLEKFQFPSHRKLMIMQSYARFLEKTGQIEQLKLVREKTMELSNVYQALAKKETGLVYQ